MKTNNFAQVAGKKSLVTKLVNASVGLTSVDNPMTITPVTKL